MAGLDLESQNFLDATKKFLSELVSSIEENGGIILDSSNYINDSTADIILRVINVKRSSMSTINGAEQYVLELPNGHVGFVVGSDYLYTLPNIHRGLVRDVKIDDVGFDNSIYGDGLLTTIRLKFRKNEY